MFAWQDRWIGPSEAIITCGDELHRIYFDGRNLQLPNHPHIRREVRLREFGYSCPCLEVLQAWRDSNLAGIPDPLLLCFSNWRQSRQNFRARDFENRPPFEDRVILDNSGFGKLRNLPRIQAGVKESTAFAVQTAVHASDLRFPGPVRIDVGGDPFIGRSPTDYTHDLVRIRNARDVAVKRSVYIRVGWNWEQRVFQKDLAVLDGRFILAVLLPEDVTFFREHQQTYCLHKPWWLRPFGANPFREYPDYFHVHHVLAVHKDDKQVGYPYPARVFCRKSGGHELVWCHFRGDAEA